MAEVRTVLASQHELFRLGLRYLLTAQYGFTVIGEAAASDDALALLEREAPELVVMEMNLDGATGIELLREIDSGACRVLLLADREHCHLGHAAIRAGATGFLPKTASAEEFTDACRTVARGNIYLATGMGHAALITTNGRDEVLVDTRLTRRERQVLQLLSEGQPTKEMAMRLGVSARTIETHRYQIMSKLNIRTVAGLTKYAIRQGLTTL